MQSQSKVRSPKKTSRTTKHPFDRISWMLALFISSLFVSASVDAQVEGCRDTAATNYNPAAVLNDGGCMYASASYTPLVKVNPFANSLTETSGLQWAGNFLWTFNDSGGDAAIFRIDTVTNKVLQKVVLQGAVNIDWETLTFDGTHFFIGDVGNNANGGRTNFTIYRFALAAVRDHQVYAVDTLPAAAVTRLNFTYLDQPATPLSSQANKTKWDCEAMIVTNGAIHLFTKDWIDLTTTHYVLNGTTPGNYVATPLETLATNYLVTGADKAPGKNVIVLLGYATTGAANHYLHLLSDFSGGKFFNGNKRLLQLPNALTMGQAEGITFRTDTYGYISNERIAQFNINARLFSFDLANFISPEKTFTFNGNGNWNDAANWSNQTVPMDLSAAGTTIIIDPSPGGQCIMNIPITLSKEVNLVIKNGKQCVVDGNLTIE